MPDIRQTAMLDDFERPDETPVQPPWFQVPGAGANMNLASGVLTGALNPPNDTSSYLEFPTAFRGSVEMWAKSTGEAPLTEGYRFGMLTVASLAVGSREGYICVPHNNVGTDTWQLRKYTGLASFTEIHSVNLGPPNGAYVLMRRDGDLVETYVSADTTSWTLVNQVADTTYLGPFFFVLGTTGTNEGWDAMGGGLRNRQHMYRWQRGFGVSL